MATVFPSLNSSPRNRSTHWQTTWRQMKRHWYAYALLVPTFALLLTFVYYPSGLALVMSLFDWIPGIKQEFVGLLNFRRVLTDPSFLNAWRNILIITVWTFTIPFVMPLLVAEGIFNLRSLRAKGIYRVAILLPLLVPGMVSLQLWKWMYGFPNGGINTLLHAVGLGDLARPWLGTTATALPSILFMGFPWIIGIAPLIYLAGLMNISSEVIDASRMDGATTWERIRFVDIPAVMGQIRLFFVLGVIGILQEFGPQLVLTQGGPSGATMVPGLYLYLKAFGIDRLSRNLVSMGEAAAVGVILFAVIVVVSLLGNRRLSGVDGTDD